jgi:UPF0176 protein
MDTSEHYGILLYYKYVEVADPTGLMHVQRMLCERLGLMGRIIVAHEGINGTVEGTAAACQEYMDIMKQDERFADINFKISEGTGVAFPRLSIKVRPEIVATGLDDKKVGPLHGKTGTYLSADELYAWYEQGREFYIVDMRNDYEYDVGRFKNSLFPEGLYHFRDLPKNVEKIAHLRGKTVVTVCTGGVRCETASGLLLEHGFADVYQLHNGMHDFIAKFPNTFFEGKMYVFDGRETWGFGADLPGHEVVGRCRVCGGESEHFVNWNEESGERKHGIVCPECCAAGKVELQEGYRKRQYTVSPA